MKIDQMMRRRGLWVFAEERSGSTFFCKVLNSKKLLNSDLEERLQEVRETGDKQEFLRAYNKIECGQLKFVKLIPPDILNIKKFIPHNKVFIPTGHKHILLRRRNKIEQTISYCMAIETGFYHRHMKTKAFDYSGVDLSEELLRTVYSYYKKNEYMLESFLKEYNLEYMDIYYEDLIQDKEKTFIDVCEYLDLNLDDIKKRIKESIALAPKKIKYKEYSYFKKKLIDALENGD